MVEPRRTASDKEVIDYYLRQVEAERDHYLAALEEIVNHKTAYNGRDRDFIEKMELWLIAEEALPE